MMSAALYLFGLFGIISGGILIKKGDLDGIISLVVGGIAFAVGLIGISGVLKC